MRIRPILITAGVVIFGVLIAWGWPGIERTLLQRRIYVAQPGRHGPVAGIAHRSRITGKPAGPQLVWSIDTGMVEAAAELDGGHYRVTIWGTDGRVSQQAEGPYGSADTIARAPPWRWGAADQAAPSAPWIAAGITPQEWWDSVEPRAGPSRLSELRRSPPRGSAEESSEGAPSVRPGGIHGGGTGALDRDSAEPGGTGDPRTPARGPAVAPWTSHGDIADEPADVGRRGVRPGGGSRVIGNGSGRPPGWSSPARLALLLATLGGLHGAGSSIALAGPIDIILAVDTSGDMDDETAAFIQELNGYAAALTGVGHDAHFVLIASGVCVPAPLGSGACPGDQQLPLYRHVDQTIGSNDALELILLTYPLWQASLRPGAERVIMVVSSDDSDWTAAQFQTQLFALDPSFQGYQFHACVAQSSCPPIGAAMGQIYLDLVVATGGIVGDLCGQSIQPFMVQSAAAAGDLADAFRRGDANRDGAYDIGDAIATLGHLFAGGSLPCHQAVDSNDDEALDIADAIYTLGALFSGGPAPPPPSASCGGDPTPGGLDCAGPLPCL